MMNKYTGKSLRNDAKIAPRRATLSLGAPNARCTMYWSVHQYHKPIIGAQINMPTQGKFPLKYHASLITCPAASMSRTGAQLPCTPAGISGFHRLNMSEPHQTRSSCHPPSLTSPYAVREKEPRMSTNVCTASL